MITMQMKEGITNPSKLSRRDFLKISGAGVAGLTLSYLISRIPQIQNALESGGNGNKINLLFFQEYHQNNPNKLARFESMFDRADVFVTEFGPWNANDLEWFRSHERPNKIEKPWDLVFGSNKPVFFIDPDASDPVWIELKEIENNSAPDYVLPFEQAVARLTDYLIREVEVHKKRELVWEMQLTNIIKLLHNSSLFRGKNNIGIMIETGAYHTSIYHDLSEIQNDNYSTERIFSESPITFPKRHETMRRLLFNNQLPTVDDMQKTMLEAMIDDVFGAQLSLRFVDSPSSKSRYLRKITNMFSPNEIKTTFNQLSAIKNSNNVPANEAQQNARNWFTKYLSEKGIEIN